MRDSNGNMPDIAPYQVACPKPHPISVEHGRSCPWVVTALSKQEADAALMEHLEQRHPHQPLGALAKAIERRFDEVVRACRGECLERHEVDALVALGQQALHAVQVIQRFERPADDVQ